MNKKEKFKNFLESLKDGKHNNLIESVKKGLNACIEASDYAYRQLDDFNTQVSASNGNAKVKFDLIFTPTPEEIKQCPAINKLVTQYMENTKKTLDQIAINVVGTFEGKYSMHGKFTQSTRWDEGESPDIQPITEEYTSLSVNLSDDDGNVWPEEPIKLENKESPDYKLARGKAEIVIEHNYDDIYRKLLENSGDDPDYDPLETKRSSHIGF